MDVSLNHATNQLVFAALYSLRVRARTGRQSCSRSAGRTSPSSPRTITTFTSARRRPPPPPPPRLALDIMLCKTSSTERVAGRPFSAAAPMPTAFLHVCRLACHICVRCCEVIVLAACIDRSRCPRCGRGRSHGLTRRPIDAARPLAFVSDMSLSEPLA